jgi:hypothetical protein
MATTTQGEAAMTTILFTEEQAFNNAFDRSVAAEIIASCDAPNIIETGFTPTPISELLRNRMEDISCTDTVLSLVADRFPVYCLEIREETTRMRYYFEISSINLRVWCDISRDGFIIHTPGIEFTNADDVIGFAKGMNAITEWAREAA